MTPQYLNLNLRAPARLADLKRRAAKRNALTAPYGSAAVKTWRYERTATLNGHPRLSEGRNGSQRVWITFDGPAFPRETWADEVEHSPVDHAGWFADPDGADTYRAFVVALPRGRFMAGYNMSDNAERVYFERVFNDARDAACWADRQAQQDAETEREYQERWREARDLEDDIADKLGRLRESLALRNHKCFPDMRRRAAALLERIRDARQKLANDYADVAE